MQLCIGIAAQIHFKACFFLSFFSDADLNIAQTAWGDSGVYVCTVSSSMDLSGNGEDYTELIVLGKIHE